MKHITNNKVKVSTAFAIVCAALVNVVMVSAGEEEANLFISNLSKGEITEIILSVSHEYYPQNRNGIVFQDLQISESSISGLFLPGYMMEANAYDIEIVVDGKRFVSQRGVMIDLSSGKIPTLHLSTTELGLTEGLKEAAPNLAITALWVTTKKVAPKVGAKILGKAIVPMAFPNIGWIIVGSIILYECGSLLYNHVIAPGELWVQVDYN